MPLLASEAVSVLCSVKVTSRCWVLGIKAFGGHSSTCQSQVSGAVAPPTVLLLWTPAAPLILRYIT